MKAAVWCGSHHVAVEDVPDPTIINPRDAIVRVTSTCICGSDLHLYDGVVSYMRPGDILGHETLGVVAELGPGIDRAKVKVGDRVIVPFCIGCGACYFCRKGLWSCCENTNPKTYLGEQMFGHGTCGIYGYSHLTGGYAGGQAQYLRVPLADANLQVMPADLPDHQLVLLSDVLPTGYMAAEQCGIEHGDTVAVWGCGPVGQIAIRSAFLLGAGQVIAIDNARQVPERCGMARAAGAEVIDTAREDVQERLKELTGGLGPDRCIDAVGMEAHGTTFLEAVSDRLKHSLMLEIDQPSVVRQAILCCRKGGTVSIAGVYGGTGDGIPLGALMNKALTIRTGQTHVHRYVPALLEHIRAGRINPSEIITHRLPLSQVSHAYELFRHRRDGVVKVVLDPAA